MQGLTQPVQVIDQKFGDNWALYHGDCCQVVKGVPDASVGLSVFSPPFSNLYIYSDSAFDMGNAVDDAEFLTHFGYLAPELFRVTIPGRLCVVHCKDLPKYRNRDGVAGLKDFPGQIIALFESHGWTYHSRVTIWKCPVVEMERTKNHGLLHKTVRADSSAVRQGMADYLVVFRRPPTDGLASADPIVRPTGFKEWHGDPTLDPRVNDWHPSKYARKGKMSLGNRQINDSIRIWQRMADPVWFHIDQQDVLNYTLGKSNKDEKHICPLQLGAIREAVGLWSNPGDVVMDPFGGIGSTGHEAVRMGRKFVGFELKESYFREAVRNLTAAERSLGDKDLFSDFDPEAGDADG